MLKQTISLVTLSALACVYINCVDSKPVEDKSGSTPVSLLQPGFSFKFETDGKEIQIKLYKPEELIETEVQDKKLVIPQFSMNATILSEARHEFDNNTIVEVANKVSKLAEQVLDNENVFTLGKTVSGIFLTMLNTFNANRKLKKKDKKSQVLESGLGPVNGAMLEAMLDDKPVGSITKEEAEKRVKIVEKAIKAIREQGSYVVRLSNMTISGTQFENFLEPVMKKFREIGENEINLITNGGEILDWSAKTINGENFEHLMCGEQVIDKEEAKKRVNIVMEGVKEITYKSNTGLVLRWRDLTVDNQSLEQFLKPAIKKLIEIRPSLKSLLGKAAFYMRDTVNDRKV
jgi:hypothetical protein